MTDPTRRLRVVPPLPGQLTLDLAGLPPPVEPASPVSRRAGLAGSAEPGAVAGGLVRRLLSTRLTDDGPALPARVPVAVWAVWDGEDLVGVYADESSARADARVLQRDAARAGHRGRRVDCLPLQVFTEQQHTRR